MAVNEARFILLLTTFPMLWLLLLMLFGMNLGLDWDASTVEGGVGSRHLRLRDAERCSPNRNPFDLYLRRLMNSETISNAGSLRDALEGPEARYLM